MKRLAGKWCISALLGFLMVFLVCSCSFAETAKVSWWNGSKVQTQQLPLEVNDKYVYAVLPNGTISIVSYFGDEEIADIAAAFPEKTISSINTHAFYLSQPNEYEFNDTIYKYTSGEKIKQIIIPDTVQYLGYYWLAGVVWNHYIEYNIPAQLKYVSAEALNNLQITEIPFFPDIIFEEGYQLSGSRADVLSFAPEYKSIPSGWCSWFSGKEIVIPEGIQIIENNSFEYLNLYLEKIQLPQSLTRIEDNAFTGRGVDKYTPALVISLPDSLTHIGKNVLADTNIKTLTIPANLTNIDDTAFAHCPMTTLVFAEGTTAITTRAFADRAQLATLNLPTTLTTIGERCFLRSGLTKLVIPANVTTIGEAAFKNSEKLKDITLPANLTNIANDAFDGCAVDAVFTVFTGTYAEQWANERGYKTKVLVPVTEIMLNEESVTLNKGRSVTLKATVGPKEATNRKVEWISTDSDVATVQNGQIQAKGCGSCDIICRAADGSGTQAVCQVTVIQMIASLQAKSQKLTIPYGGAGEVEVTLKPDDATNKTLDWTSSDENVCVVDKTGKIMSVGSGDCEIVCSTTDGSNKSVKIKVHVPIFDSTEASYTVTEKDGLFIPVDLHGVSVADVTHKSSSDKYFLYYFDKDGLHIFPVAEGAAKITLTSKLNMQDKTIYNVTVDKAALYDAANGEAAPLNVIVTLDKSEVEPGEQYTVKYHITGGVPPYTVKEGKSNELSINPLSGGGPDIGLLTTAYGSKSLKAATFGTNKQRVEITVVDSVGNVNTGYSNTLDIDSLRAKFDYDYYAMPLNEPIEIKYSITGGSGEYQVKARWELYKGQTSIYDFATETQISKGEGSVTIIPSDGDQISLNLWITDKKNKNYSLSYSTPIILLTDGWSLKVSYDKYEAQVGDQITATLHFVNAGTEKIDYSSIQEKKFDSESFWMKDISKNPQFISFAKGGEGYSYTKTIGNCDTFQLNVVLKEGEYSRYAGTVVNVEKKEANQLR